MSMNLTQKIIKNHLVSGEMIKGKEIKLKIDQTLTQDSTGTMAYLQFESLGIDKVRTKRSVAYIDHNMLQEGFENADDHKYIQSVASKFGIYFSKPGNGVCHQVNLERFATPGETLIGSDSHTPTAGGVGMLAIGAGGLDVALAMAGEAYAIPMPAVVNVELLGSLQGFASGKDVILEVLRRLTVKGGVGRIIEYSGEGIKSLSVTDRATITNMGAELGATTSIFPSDEITLKFLEAQGRKEDYIPLSADSDATYDEKISINLSELTPLVACPHSPDNIKKVEELKDIKIDQIIIGSCTNGSFSDFVKVAKILKGKKVAPHVSFVLAPGSRQVLTMLSESGYLVDLLMAGARLIEVGCGPCIGMGQAPATDAVSLRTFNRNFLGRCGTKSASVYLGSPEIAAASAITGYFTNPESLGLNIEKIKIDSFLIDDSMILSPSKEPKTVEIQRGPNIKPFPTSEKLPNNIEKKVLIKLEDNITTDHIMPSNAKLLPFRSNIPYLSNFCLSPCDENFAKNAIDNNGGIIVAGDNYGQGSSREHAALAPLYLKIKAVIAKSFARIHKANLINSGIIPLTFKNADDYLKIDKDDVLEFSNLLVDIKLKDEIKVINKTKNTEIVLDMNVSEFEREMLLNGGKLNYVKLKLK